MSFPDVSLPNWLLDAAERGRRFVVSPSDAHRVHPGVADDILARSLEARRKRHRRYRRRMMV